MFEEFLFPYGHLCNPHTHLQLTLYTGAVVIEAWDRKRLYDFNPGKTHIVSLGGSHNSAAIDVKMDGSVLEEKSCFEMLGCLFSSKLNWSSHIVSVAKTTFKKIRALICYHIWAGAPSNYLKLLDKLEKQVCRTACPSLIYWFIFEM